MLSKNLNQMKEYYGCQKSMCDNCAFRLDSPEVTEFADMAIVQAQLGEILEAIDLAVEGESEYLPFFCHQGMPTKDNGHNFQPETDADGMPIGYPICAGWLNEVYLQLNDTRRSSLGKRFPSFFRVWDRVSKQKI